jgi:osmoprotectant transport system ATP-binding protein
MESPSLEPPPPAFELRQVGKEHPGGVVALREVSLTIAAGETFALIGESGSGKTTLLRLLNRMAEPSRGQILHRGRDLAGEDAIALRRRTGYVQQDGGLIPHWTVERNVELVPTLLGWPAQRRRERAAAVLSQVGLDPSLFTARYPSELSGGQRQRVALARAIAAEPPVLLLDEPFSALDPLIRRQLRRQFQALRRQLTTTAVLVTHDLREALELGDRVGVLRQGELHQVATPDELVRRPASDYVAELLQEAGGLP